LRRAERIADRVVSSHTGDVDFGVGDDFATLNVDATDLLEVAGGGTIGGQELSDDSHGLGGIDGETSAVEGLVTHTERVEVATSLVTGRRTSCSGATVEAIGSARMRGIRGGHVVGFPNVHLVTARSPVTSSRVG